MSEICVSFAARFDSHKCRRQNAKNCGTKRDRKNRDARAMRMGIFIRGVRSGSYCIGRVAHGISRRTKCVAKVRGARALELQPLNAELNWGELAKSILKMRNRSATLTAAGCNKFFCQIHINKRQINKRQCTQTIAMWSVSVFGFCCKCAWL